MNEWDVVGESPAPVAPRAPAPSSEWDVVAQAPIAPQTQVSPWDVARRAGSSFLNAANAYASAPVVGAARLVDMARGNSDLSDFVADKFVSPSLEQIEHNALKPRENAGAVGNVVLGAAPELGKTVPDIVEGAGLMRATPRAIVTGADTALKAAGNVFREGFPMGVPAGIRTGGERSMAMQEEGVGPITAGVQGAGTGLLTDAQFALPMSAGSSAATLPARIASRGAQGAALSTGSGMTQRSIENFILPEQAARLRQDVADPASLATEAALGFLLGQAGGRAPRELPSRRELGYPEPRPPLEMAPVEPRETRPAPATDYDPIAAARAINERIYQAPEGAPEAPPLRLIPKGDEAPAGVRPAPDVSEVPMRVAPDLQLEGGDQVGRIRREIGEPPLEPSQAPIVKTTERVAAENAGARPNVPMPILKTIDTAARESGLPKQITPRIDEIGAGNAGRTVPPVGREGALNLEGLGDGTQPRAVDSVSPAPPPPPPVAAAPEVKRRPGTAFLQAIRKAGGISTQAAGDIGGDTPMVLNRRAPGLFRREGMSADRLVEWAESNGYVTRQDIEQADRKGVGGSEELARDLVRRAMRDEEVVPLRDEQAQMEERDRAQAEESAYSYAESLGVDTRGKSIEDVDRLIAEKTSQRAVEVTDDLKPSDAGDVEMVARASEIDESGVERLAVQHPDGGQDFMAGIRRIIENGESNAADKGVENVPGNAPESRPAGGEPAPQGTDAAAGPLRGGDGAGERAGAQASGSGGAEFKLEQPSESGLRATDLERQRADEQRRRVENAPPPNEFKLTGSDRAADEGAASGQKGLFEAAREAEEAARGEKKESGDSTLYANPVEPVLSFAKKALGLDDAHLGRLVEDVKAMFAKGDKKQNPAAAFVRTIAYSIDGQFRALEKVYTDASGAPSKAIGAIRRMFNADPGQGTAVGRTYGEAVNLKSIEYRNQLMDALGSYVDKFGDVKAASESKASMRAQLARKLQNRSSLGTGDLDNAARSVGTLLDNIVGYMKEAGLKIEKIPDYFPRVVDINAVLRNPNAFKDAARRAYERAGLSPDEARTAADAYHKQLTLGGQGVVEAPFVDFGNSIPRADFAKHRLLGKAADDILRDFLIQDPLDVLETYIHKAVRRAEWARRLGGEVTYANADGKQVKGSKYDAMRADILKEGNAKAVPLVDDLVRASVGEIPSNIGAGMRSVVSWARALTVIEFLRHATLTSLTEPIINAARTGRARDLAKGYIHTFEDIAARVGKVMFGETPDWYKNSDTGKAKRIAELAGIVENHLAVSAAHVLQADGMIESSKLPNKLATRATILTGLRQWTDATRIASVRVGMEFIRYLAEDAAKGDRVSQRGLRELGIPDAQQSAFGSWLLGQQDLEASLKRGENKAMNDAYVTALGRFADHVIMAPKNADKPYWANHPVGSIAYSLTGYLYAFQQNVMNRMGRMAKDALTDGELTVGERTRLLAPIMYLSMIPIMQVALVPLRDALKGTPQDKRDKKWRESTKINLPFLSEIDTHIPQGVSEGISRAGVTGAADPWINMLTNAKYEKRPSSVLVGPFGQNVEQTLTDTFGRNSPNTNTQERQVAKDVYQAFVDPAVTTFATAYLPAPAAMAVSMGMSMDRTKNAFQDVAAGMRKPSSRSSSSYLPK